MWHASGWEMYWWVVCFALINICLLKFKIWLCVKLQELTFTGFSILLLFLLFDMTWDMQHLSGQPIDDRAVLFLFNISPSSLLQIPWKTLSDMGTFFGLGVWGFPKRQKMIHALLLRANPYQAATFCAVCWTWYWLNQTNIFPGIGAKMAVKADSAAIFALMSSEIQLIA